MKRYAAATSEYDDPTGRANRRGIAFILAAAVSSVGVAAQVKAVGQALPPMEIALVRSLVALVLVGPMAVRQGLHALVSARPAMMTVRALNAAAIIVLNIYAVAHLPLVDFTAIGFAKPLVLIPIAALALGDKVKWRRALATIVGFAGVLMIVRPTGALDPAALAALLATILLAVGVIFVKLLSRTENVTRMMVWSSLIVALAVAPVALANWLPPTPGQWAGLIGIGVLGTATQVFIIRAYEAGNPTVVAPFDYARILFATLAGLIFFAELPDLWTLAGTLVVVGAGGYVAWRDAHLGRPPPPNPGTT